MHPLPGGYIPLIEAATNISQITPKLILLAGIQNNRNFDPIKKRKVINKFARQRGRLKF